MGFYKLLIIFIFFIFFSCGGISSDQELEKRIHDQIKSGQQVLDLNEIADFEWDSLIILTPYSNIKTIENNFKIDLSKVEHSNIDNRKDINLLVFFDKGKTIRMVEYPRYPGDFADNKIEFIPRNRAVYDIVITSQKTVGGEKWIELKMR